MRVLLGFILLGFAATVSAAAAPTPARAGEWCGFIDKAGARVHCGYSSLAECKQAIGDKKDQKDIYCLPDPTFAELRRAAGNG